jgi:RNA polymerase-binding transcription factor DksA
VDNQEIQYLRALLIMQKKDIDRTIESMKHNGTSEQDKYSPTELSNYDNHPAEMGTQLFQVEQNTAQKVHEEHLLKEIHDALGRMEDGIYGKCAFCGQEISVERLEALPYVRLCMDCEQNKTVDPEILAKGRPNEELRAQAAKTR